MNVEPWNDAKHWRKLMREWALYFRWVKLLKIAGKEFPSSAKNALRSAINCRNQALELERRFP